MQEGREKTHLQREIEEGLEDDHQNGSTEPKDPEKGEDMPAGDGFSDGGDKPGK